MNDYKQSNQVILFVLYFLFLNCLSFSQIYYVNWNCQGDGSSWESSFLTLQQALDVVDPGDEIWVAAGIYYPTTSNGRGGDRYKHFQMKPGVGIYGGFLGNETTKDHRDVRNNETILSGDIGKEKDPNDNCYHVFFHGSGFTLDASTVLDGFTITGGYANGDYGNSAGGGMYNRDRKSPTLIDCTFIDNYALEEGGAIFNYWYCNINLKNCIFENNRAELGAGLYNYKIFSTITDCVFRNNEALNCGGGMFNRYSEIIVTDCQFIRNFAINNRGGGIDNLSQTNLTLQDCVFRDNHAYKGGGIAHNETNGENIRNRCVFVGNTAHYGAGAYTHWGRCHFNNCVFSGNVSSGHGGGLYNGYQSNPTLTGCTLTQNQAHYGGGISNQNGTVILENSILWNNTALFEGNEIHIECTRAVCWLPRISNCNIQGCGGSGLSWNHSNWQDKEGNIDMVPGFVDPDGPDNISGTVDDNLKLLPNSSCIDLGDNGYVYDQVDLERIPRILDGDFDGFAIVDIGAYEFAPSIKASVDIRPQTCPNPVNLNSKGILPVAILGSDVFDVNNIDLDTITLEGAIPLRSSYEDVANPVIDETECTCTLKGADGYIDLALKFDTQEIVAALGEVSDGDMWMLTLTGYLKDGTPIEGTDCIEIKKKGKP